MDTTSVALPFVFVLFAWWFSTGLILWLDGLPRRTFPWTMTAATAVCVAGLVGLAVSSAQTSVASAYCAFTCALLVWAWQEVAFLLGYVTGPRRIAADPTLTGWPRAWQAFLTVLHHELALLVLGGLVLAVSWGQPNQTGWWTFAILWAMRQSAKLNVFLGVRNLGENFLPPHLAYLASYFARKRMNALLPVSVLGGALVAAPLWGLATAAPLRADAFGATAAALAASLLSLAILEHVLLVLPLSTEGLWRWGMRSRPAEPGAR